MILSASGTTPYMLVHSNRTLQVAAEIASCASSAFPEEEATTPAVEEEQ